jgi:hypothetical protein
VMMVVCFQKGLPGHPFWGAEGSEPSNEVNSAETNGEKGIAVSSGFC